MLRMLWNQIHTLPTYIINAKVTVCLSRFQGQNAALILMKLK